MIQLPSGLEIRASIEMRAASGRRLEGHAAVFNVRAKIGDFHETIRPGAFRGSLGAGGDIVALVDHDPTRLIARTRSNTLRLSEDQRGLAFDLDLPDTTLGRDLQTLAERRDLGGMSFGFRVTDEAWPSRTERELRTVELVEVSVVQAFPAYTQTDVNLRGRPRDDSDTRARIRRLYLQAI